MIALTTEPCAISRAVLLWLRVQELEGRPVPTLRAVSQIVNAAGDETTVHRAVVSLRNSGHVAFGRIHTGRVITVPLTGAGRQVGDREIAGAGLRIDPVTTRRCLSCSRHFVSEHRGHRICDHCKDTQVWRNADMRPLHV